MPMTGDHGLEEWRRRSGHSRRRPTVLVVAALLCVGVGVGARSMARDPARDEPSVRFRDGVLDAGGARLRVGEPGDVLVTGRWRCGPATVALLRPATGEVFRFDDWARPGQAATATVVATIPGATALRAAAAPTPGCDDLEVLRAS